jgi:hypothetical protein
MKPLNKVLVYTVIAILLGSVTMLAPLALLGDSAPDIVTQVADSNNLDRAYEDNQTLKSGNVSTENWTRPDELSTPSDSSESSPPEYFVTADTEDASDLSPIGWMTIPSFLLALGVFVYLRKRVN